MATMIRSVVLPLLFSLALTPLVTAWLLRRKVLDHPSGRSLHNEPTPRGGGLAPGLATLITLAVLHGRLNDQLWALGIAGLCFLGIGLFEDLVGLSVGRRIALQTLVAFGVTPLMLDIPDRVPWAVIVLIVASGWLVSFVNAFNFMDGINGISVAQVAVAGFAWGLIGLGEGLGSFALGGLVVAGAALGFGPYNFPRAHVFLGDAGSYFFGGWLACLALIGFRHGLSPEAVLGPLALYIADVGVTLLRRIREGEDWRAPHRQHVYQQLVIQGRTHGAVSLQVLLLTTACSLLGTLSLTGSLPLRIVGDLAALLVLWHYLRLPRASLARAR